MKSNEDDIISVDDINWLDIIRELILDARTLDGAEFNIRLNIDIIPNIFTGEETTTLTDFIKFFKPKKKNTTDNAPYIPHICPTDQPTEPDPQLNKNTKRVKNAFINVPPDKWTMLDDSFKYYSEGDKLIIKYHNTNIETTWSDAQRIAKLDFTNQGIEIFKIIGFTEQKLTMYKRFIDNLNNGTIKPPSIETTKNSLDISISNKSDETPSVELVNVDNGNSISANNEQNDEIVNKGNDTPKQFIEDTHIPPEPQQKYGHIVTRPDWIKVPGKPALKYILNNENIKIRNYTEELDITWEIIEELCNLSEKQRPKRIQEIIGNCNPAKLNAINSFTVAYILGKIKKPNGIYAKKIEPVIAEKQNQSQNQHQNDDQNETIKNMIKNGEFLEVDGAENLFYIEDGNELLIDLNGIYVKTTWSEIVKLSILDKETLSKELTDLLGCNFSKKQVMMKFLDALENDLVIPPDNT